MDIIHAGLAARMPRRKRAHQLVNSQVFYVRYFELGGFTLLKLDWPSPGRSIGYIKESIGERRSRQVVTERLGHDDKPVVRGNLKGSIPCRPIQIDMTSVQQ